MKYFFFHRKAHLGSGQVLIEGTDNIGKNILLNEEDVKEAVNKGYIDQYLKTPSFKVGDYVTIGDGNLLPAQLKNLKNSTMKVESFDLFGGSLILKEAKGNFFYIQDLKTVQ